MSCFQSPDPFPGDGVGARSPPRSNRSPTRWPVAGAPPLPALERRRRRRVAARRCLRHPDPTPGRAGRGATDLRGHRARPPMPTSTVAARRAATGDIDLAVAWAAAFAADTGSHVAPDQPVRCRRWIAAGRLWLWEVDGEPVEHGDDSVDVERRGRPGGLRLHARRAPRSGYAAAVTAHVSDLVLGRG